MAPSTCSAPSSAIPLVRTDRELLAGVGVGADRRRRCRHGVRARDTAPPLPARCACLPDGDVRAGAGRQRGGSADLGTGRAAGAAAEAAVRRRLPAGEPFPVYRLFLAASGIVVAIAIWQLLERTRLGLLIRATSQNAEMVHALGIDVNLVRSAVFGIGCGLGALGGVLAAPLVTASHGMAATVIIDAFVIVIIGGMGSFLGSLIGALLVAFVQVFGNYYFPDFALASMYLLMLLVLVVRPGGLLGKEA